MGRARTAVLGLMWLVSVAASLVAARGAGVDGLTGVRFLWDRGAGLLAVVWAGLLLAPLLLGVTGLMVRRTPWPWVAGTTAYLGLWVAAAARLWHLATPATTAAVVGVVVLGLTSITAALSMPSRGLDRLDQRSADLR